MAERAKIVDYTRPAGGWGSLKSVVGILRQEKVAVRGSEILMKQNKPDGFMCVSCSWAKPAKPHPFEFCENGAKATAWETTTRTVTPAFFEAHTLSELRSWSDYALEDQGRLTEPMRYDADSDKYVPVGWDEAFAEIGRELEALDPRSVIMYVSGRASLEASYMYQLFGRMYGTNNFPDSSNMCHESTSVALPPVIGVPVGTVLLDDFDHADCILFFGHNTTTNAPRMLHPLRRAAKRGVPIVTFNPLRERGLEQFTNPQSPTEMIATGPTRISTDYHQVKPGGDTAAIIGVCKAVIEADDVAKTEGRDRVVDVEFLDRHTRGFDDFAEFCRRQPWADLERASAISREAMESVAAIYARSNAVIANYGMGITQHRYGVETVKMIVNLLLLRGNIGKAGAGICPVRGHSNVQGQRTVGITEKTELASLDRLKALYEFEPPTENGRATVGTCEGLLDGSVRGFVSLGGNFARSAPDHSRLEPAWQKMRLSVQIATKLNRSHVLPAEKTFLLPCLGRIDIDEQATGPQAVSMEDSTACIHGSRGQRRPVSPDLLSEPKIVAELAKATLPPNPNVDWDAWVADYSRIRDAIETTWPTTFKDMNRRMFEPGGFARPLAARRREWNTSTGKANFTVPESLSDRIEEKPDVFQLITLRADSQFNTTVYANEDRFRGIYGSRDVVLMNPADIERAGLQAGDDVTLETDADDGVRRTKGGLQVVSYNIPERCLAAYYPECNVLLPVWHHALEAGVPAGKSIPVRVRKESEAAP